TFDGIRLEARAVVHVGDEHLLVCDEVGELHELGIDGDRADVLDIGFGHRRVVDLRLQKLADHRSLTLSIRRVAPTRMAPQARSPSPVGWNVAESTTSK